MKVHGSFISTSTAAEDMAADMAEPLAMAAAGAVDTAHPRLRTADRVEDRVASLPHHPQGLQQAQTPSKHHLEYGPCPDAELWVLVCSCRLWNWFTSVDTDRSGHITAHELRKCRHV